MAIKERPGGPANTAAWNSRLASVGGLEQWSLEGRVAIVAGKDGWNGSLSWAQQGDDLDFRFKGPFGIGGVRIHGNAGQLRVKTTKGEEFFTDNPERDFGDRLGWTLPIHSMRYWMVGVPDPERPFRQPEIDAAGLAYGLSQEGWTVAYDDYTEAGEFDLPRKFEISNSDVRIKVVVSRWQLPGAEDDDADDFIDL